MNATTVGQLATKLANYDRSLPVQLAHELPNRSGFSTTGRHGLYVSILENEAGEQLLEVSPNYSRKTAPTIGQLLDVLEYVAPNVNIRRGWGWKITDNLELVKSASCAGDILEVRIGYSTARPEAEYVKPVRFEDVAPEVLAAEMAAEEIAASLVLLELLDALGLLEQDDPFAPLTEGDFTIIPAMGLTVKTVVLKNRFDRLVIEPSVFASEDDKAKGLNWRVQLRMNNGQDGSYDYYRTQNVTQEQAEEILGSLSEYITGL